MPVQVIGRVVTPPKGWEWVEGKLCPKSLTSSPAKFDDLYAWAKKRGYGLKPEGSFQVTTPSGAYVHVYHIFTVWKDSWDMTLQYLGDGKWDGGSLGTLEYVGNSGYTWNSCASCTRSGLKTRLVAGVGYTSKLCGFCSAPCADKCGEWVPSQLLGIRDISGGKCIKCFPRVMCNYCNRYTSLDEATRLEGSCHICNTCADSRRCEECNSIEKGKPKQHEGKQLCESCYVTKLDASRIQHETFDEGELPKGGSLTLAQLPNRPVRVISIETEVNGDAGTIASTLYNCGLIREPFVESYGTRVPEESAWPAFLKHDGSVTGGELITYLLELNKKEHADSLKEILSKLRSLNKIGAVQYSENCGGHIHIDAHNFSSDNLWRLLTVYNFLEDVIYRLAGSGHSYGHRTLVPGHDAHNGGRGYSLNTKKGPWGVKSSAYLAASSQDRMTGLNFVPYFQSIRHCICGAVQEDNLRKCTCFLTKCTIEWRVWNTQGNPRIIHAWVAFMQSLHAWADTPKEMTDTEENEYPPFAWSRLPWKKTSEQHQRTAFDRIRWIFTNLVFTNEERDSLLYAFEQTDIQFPDGFLDEMRRIPTPKNRSVKAPRNCFTRKRPIQVNPPERKMVGKKVQRNAPAYITSSAALRAARLIDSWR